MEYLLTSFFLHAILFGCLSYSREVNTKSETIEVTIISKKQENVLIHPSLDKPLKSHGENSGPPKSPKIDLKDYADQLKAIIDPVYYNKILPLIPKNNTHFQTICLLFVDIRGMIVNVKVIESSGDSVIDQVAIDTFNQVKSLPKPPPELVEQGIEWEFKF